MMDDGCHMYDWVIEELPLDSGEAEDYWAIEKPVELARNNMKQWLRDIEIGPVYGFSGLEFTQDVAEPPRGNRWHFHVTGDYRLRDWRWPKRISVRADIWMPGVKIAEVRYLDPDKQSEWNFYKVIYNDHPCLWEEAVWDFVHDCEEKAERVTS